VFIPRTLAEQGRTGEAALGRALIIVTLVAASIFLVLSANITVGQENLEVGQVAPRDIRAPRDATFESDSLTQEARDAAAAAVTPVSDTVKSPADNLEDQLALFDTMTRRVGRLLALRDNGNLDTAELIQRIGSDAPEIPFADRAFVAELTAEQWQGVVEAARVALTTTLADPVREDQLAEVRDAARSLVTTDLAADERDLAGDVAAEFIEPSEMIDAESTAQRRQQARDDTPPRMVTIRQGETVVREGDRITVEVYEKLDELALTRPQVQPGMVLGNALVSVLIAAMLVAFLWRHEPEVWHRNRSLLLFFLAFVATAIVMRIAADRTLWAFVVPTSGAVLLVGILLQGGAGAAMAIGLAVLAGVMNRDALEIAVFVLAGGLASLLAITRAERLNVFVRVFGVLAATNLAVVLAFGLLQQGNIAAIFQLGLAGVANAFLSVILAVGSFHVLGNLFGIMTVFQLLELANPSNRLLRRLLLETPGTYHHSVMVGNLAERAAETIGADPLLARVAAYYHDIGKMKNPLAFIENQAGAHNIHDDLTAETSARIIAGHIRDGIDLGYEHGLPVQVIAFIPQHHGTSVMSYFHGKALREVAGREELVDERSFRYPGPKPQSREAAILMLADGVEASVRSLDQKDEESIRAMVDRIVDARVEDGQLDDAELTLKNIAQIKEAFVGQLLGMYHSRIKYPDNVVPMEQRREHA
jgi:putative nucleotidyltransferase with HDIG domain